MAKLTTIGGHRYKLLGKLSERGAFGDIYRARDLEKNIEVAVKVLKVGDDEKAVKRFQRESRKMMALDHENVLKVFNHGFDSKSGQHFYTMELIRDLKTPEEIISKFPTRAIIEIILQAASGLQYIHRHGSIHRDVKPDNLLTFLEKRRVRTKVSDLGIAKNIGLSTLTLEGFGIGTPLYASPEQISEGGKVDDKTDIYGLGASLYFFMTGRAPFSEVRGWDNLIAKKIAKIPPKSPRKINPEIIPDLEETIMKAMAADKRERYQTLDELKDALLKLEIKPLNTQTLTLMGISDLVHSGYPSQVHSEYPSQEEQEDAEITIERGRLIRGILKYGSRLAVAAVIGLIVSKIGCKAIEGLNRRHPYRGSEKERRVILLRDKKGPRIVKEEKKLIRRLGKPANINGNGLEDLYLPGAGGLIDDKYFMPDDEPLQEVISGRAPLLKDIK